MTDSPGATSARAARWRRTIGAVIQWITLVVMRLGLPLAPLLMALIRWDMLPLRTYRASMRRAAAHTAELGRIGVIRRGVEQGWGRGVERGAQIEGHCTHCGKCCINGLCVFVAFDAQGRSSCAIHGKWFFRWLSCGRYPLTQRDIDAYQCPSFRAVPLPSPARRVVPLKVER